MLEAEQHSRGKIKVVLQGVVSNPVALVAVQLVSAVRSRDLGFPCVRKIITISRLPLTRWASRPLCRTKVDGVGER